MLKRLREISRSTKNQRFIEEVKNKTSLLTRKEVFEEPIFISPGLEIKARENGGFEKAIFVFSGGGLKGLSYIPVIQFFQKNDYYPLFVVGTSAGALATIPYALKEDPQEAWDRLGLEKYFSSLSSNLNLALRYIKHKTMGFLGIEVLENLKKELSEKGINFPSQIDKYFGVFCVGGFKKAAIFGAYKDLKLSKEIPLYKAVYASLAVPPVFSPILLENIHLDVIDFPSNTIRNAYFQKTYAYDGAAFQIIPLETAKILGDLLFPGEKILYVVFNSSYSHPEYVELKNSLRVIEDFIQSIVYKQSIDSISSKLHIPFIMYNLNYDNKMSRVWYDRVEEKQVFLDRGKEFAEKIKETLPNYLVSFKPQSDL